MVEIIPEEKAAPEFKTALHRTAVKMLATAYNYTGKHMHGIYLVVSFHPEDYGADLSLFFRYDTHILPFENLDRLRIKDNSTKGRVMTFDVSQEKQDELYNNLQRGVADLHTAFGDTYAVPTHLYMQADIPTNETRTSMEFFHEDDTPTSHSDAAAHWLQELQEGHVEFFQNMLQEFDREHMS